MRVSCEEQYFPIHQMKPCQEDWQKLVFKEKLFCFRENWVPYLTILLNKIQWQQVHTNCGISCRDFKMFVPAFTFEYLP